MITLTINEKDPHVLRVSASYLLALAAPEEAHEAHGLNHVTGVHNELVEVFNQSELAEAETLGLPHFTGHAMVDAASVFGKTSDVALSTVAVETSTTVPEVTTATTLVPPPTAHVPPVQNVAPVAPIVAPPVANPATGVELDVKGLPWDSRIHSREKTKLANGAWKYKRGVEDKVIADVEGELRNLMAIPAPTGIVAPPPLVPAEVVIVPPSIAVAPVPPAIIAPPANPSSEPFPALMTKVASAIAARKLNQAQVIAIVQQQGVQSLPGLIQRPDLIPNIEALIDAQIFTNEASGVAQ